MPYSICKYYIDFYFHTFIFFKCLPESPFFTKGSSYPPSTHMSGSGSHYGISESYSHTGTPLEISHPPGASKRERVHVNKDLLARLKTAGLDIDESLCYDTNPSLQVMYQRYKLINKIYAKVTDLVTERTWPKELGKAPNQTEVVSLFVARTTWHNSYVKVFPLVEGYEDMQSWLDGSDDCKSDLQIWGVVKSKYTVGDLIEWIGKQKGKKGKSPSKSVATSSTKPTTKSAKGKELVAASGSGSKKGKEKEVVVEEVEKKKKKSHKKKPAASG